MTADGVSAVWYLVLKVLVVYERLACPGLVCRRLDVLLGQEGPAGHRVLGVFQLQALFKTLLRVVYILLRANQGMITSKLRLQD